MGKATDLVEPDPNKTCYLIPEELFGLLFFNWYIPFTIGYQWNFSIELSEFYWKIANKFSFVLQGHSCLSFIYQIMNLLMYKES